MDIAHETTIVEVFLESLDRCMENEDFIPSFYHRFLDSSEEVRARFARTDFQRQATLLVRSLRMIAGVVVGDRDALLHLNERAETHDRRHLDIRPELYDLWRDAMIRTAQEHDCYWGPAQLHAWRQVLDQAIHHMVKAY